MLVMLTLLELGTRYNPECSSLHVMVDRWSWASLEVLITCTCFNFELTSFDNISVTRYNLLWIFQQLQTISWQGERERNVLFNDALNTFYLRLYGVRHMVKDHSDSEKGNPLPPHRLSINNKGSFICTIPQTG